MKNYLLVVACAFFLFSGCSGKVSVEGTVTYPDGTPLTIGTVIFETESYQVAGQLDRQGHYSLGEVRQGDKILPGLYGVRVSSQTGGTSDGAPIVKYVDEKFEQTATSGLTCDVRGSCRFDFVVEPFTKGK